MHDLAVGLIFIALVLTPCIVASRAGVVPKD
ncbi:hypothetical protein C7378_0974 [Acidipila rosea]|uniref:Uncharacterized protein n=1 Tax=Acidipila rosea TaxID=768535 RepID=A0A4R1LEG8_9BACT|nr:hypothetical protein C7378_0974 [Acidipila rosea]